MPLTESIESPPPSTTPPPEDMQSGPAAAFPWPPVSGSSIPAAFIETWIQSVFRPASLFATMPHRGFQSALAWYLPIAIVSAGIMVFWRMTWVVLGYGALVEKFNGQPFTPLSALVDFLLSPLTATIYLVIASGLAHIGLKIVGVASADYQATFRVTAFASGAQLFVAVPLVGVPIAALWVLGVTVIGLREVHRTTTGRAVGALVLPLILLSALAVILVVAGALAWLAAGGPR